MNIVWIVVLIAVFALVYAVSVEALQGAKLFASNRRLIAFCVAALSVLGMVEFFGPGGGNDGARREGGGLGFLLLPYVAMAIALIILLLLGLLRKILGALRRFGYWRKKMIVNGPSPESWAKSIRRNHEKASDEMT